MKKLDEKYLIEEGLKDVYDYPTEIIGKGMFTQTKEDRDSMEFVQEINFQKECGKRGII